MDTAQALATVAIALLALAIAFGQWWTNRQRVVMDLFEKRVNAIEEIRQLVAHVFGEGKVTFDDLIRYARITDHHRFLFGDDVNDFLKDFQKVLGKHRLAEVNQAHPKTEADRKKAGEHQFEAFKDVSKFHERFDKLAYDYVAMPMKRPRLPWGRKKPAGTPQD